MVIRQRKILGWMLAVGLLPLLLCTWPQEGRSQTGTLYLLTVKKGILDPSSSGDTYISEVETTQGHGKLQGDREVQPLSLELDIYGISASRFGLGIGLEVLGYEKSFIFADGEEAKIVVKGVHFTLKTFLRFDSFLPFIGVGIGNYYVNLFQSSGLSLRTSPEDVFNVRVGFRVMLGRLGILLEAGQTSAEAEIPGLSGDATLELGGSYTNLGLSWIF